MNMLHQIVPNYMQHSQATNESVLKPNLVEYYDGDTLDAECPKDF